MDENGTRRMMKHYEMLILRHRIRKFVAIMSAIIITTVIVTVSVAGIFSDIDDVYAAEIKSTEIFEVRTEEIVVETEEFLTEQAVSVLPEQEVKVQTLVATPEIIRNAYIVSLTDSEKFHVCQLAVVEAGGEGEDGCVAVMATVFNRYLSPNFPNTIDGVITQRGQFAKCSQVTAADIAEYPFMMSALERAMKGEDPAAEYLGERSLYFYSNVIELSANEKAMRDKISSKVLLGNQWFYGETGNMQGNML